MDIFRGLAREDIEALFKGVMLRACPRGTVFFTPDDTSEWLFVLKEGQVDIYRLTPGGKRLVIGRIGPGTVFGEMGLLGQTLQGCFAEAVEKSLVCIATQENVLNVLRQRPDVALRMLEAMGHRMRLLEERLEHIALRPVKVRLANFLLANRDPTGMAAGFTHAEIGDTIGALRQTVTETLSELQREGCVEVGHKQIRVTDHQKLKKIALGEEAAV